MAWLRRIRWVPIIVIIISSFLVPKIIYPARAESTYNVTVTDFAFTPQNLAIYPGFTIVWLNNDPVIYTLWFVRIKDQSTYALSDPIPPGGTWTHVFNEVGKLQYYSFERLWISGFIFVKLPGDCNGDGRVNYKDLLILAVNYGRLVPPGDPSADFNGDGRINYKDLGLLAVNYGKIY